MCLHNASAHFVVTMAMLWCIWSLFLLFATQISAESSQTVELKLVSTAISPTSTSLYVKATPLPIPEVPSSAEPGGAISTTAEPVTSDNVKPSTDKPYVNPDGKPTSKPESEPSENPTTPSNPPPPTRSVKFGRVVLENCVIFYSRIHECHSCHCL